jgi:hypothetical protein
LRVPDRAARVDAFDAPATVDRPAGAPPSADGRNGRDTASGMGRVMRQNTTQQMVSSRATTTRAITMGPMPASCVSVTGSPERLTVVDAPGAVVLLDAGSCWGLAAEPATASRRTVEGRGGEAEAADGCDPRSSMATTIAAPARAATILVLT